MEFVKPSRNYYIDNLKSVLIFLVVFAHLIEGYIHSSIVVKYVYLIIYIFHMPFFVFCSGYLANKNISFKKIGKYFLLYIVLQALVIIVKTITNGFFSIEWLITPYWIFWYLLSLVTWLILLKLIKNVTPLFIVAAFFAALVVGYIPIVGVAFSLSRTIVLFPFFLLGFYLKQHPIDYIKAKAKLQFLLPITTLLILAYFITQVASFEVVNLYFKQGYSESIGLLLRGLLFVFAVLLSLQIATITPSDKKNFTMFGAKTLSIYLLHWPISGVLKLFPLSLNPYLLIAIAFLLAIFICFLFSRRQFNIQRLLK